MYWLSNHAGFAGGFGFKFSLTAIAKFAPANNPPLQSSFSNEVGICYCRQILYLIVNGVFK